MQLTSEDLRGVRVVRIVEERLDARIAADFKHQMIGQIEAGRRRLVLDLSAVTFIDSSGLGAIVAVLKHLGGEGALAIAGLRQNTLAMFRLTRMDRVFSLFDDPGDAVAAIAG